MAWSTALGDSLPGVWARLLDDASGIAHVPCSVELRSYLAAVTRGLPQEAPASARQHALTCATLVAALHDAGLEPGQRDGVVPVLGTSFGAHLDDAQSPSLSAWSSAAVQSVCGLADPVTVSTACSAGADAILVGLALLRSGAAQACLCGGADVLTLGKRVGHSRLGTMSPDHLCAFDTARNGTVLGEGAAFLVLETAARARARGARPRGVLAGAGSSNDAASAVAPEPSGRSVVLAVQRALHSADLSAADVSVVNAHGSGTGANDDVEARAYTHLFAGTAAPPVVFATKGAFGHSLGATGAIEAVATLLALAHGVVPPIHRLRTPLAGFNLPTPAVRPMALGRGAGLSVTLGFGGFNTCLAFLGPESATA